MFNKKNSFLNLSKNQKSDLLTFLRNFSKKYYNLSVSEVFDKFIEDESYYFDIKQPHFEWIIEHFENEDFLREIKIYLEEMRTILETKERQKPLIEKQKAYLKEQKKRLQQQKMAKEEPTLKQLKYYKRLTKSHNIEPENLEGKSKLDLMNLIGKILDEKDDKRNFDLGGN